MQKYVAIVGLSFRFPGTTFADYWSDLMAGHDLVSQVPADRWAQQAMLHPQASHPGTARTFAAGTLGDVSGFDAAFFGISPREAAQMDPQQRLALEMAWEAIEHAGMAASQLRGTDTSVYLGVSTSDYGTRLAHDMGAMDSSTSTGIAASVAANRISYVLDLHGPSMSLDTACSSSLVAIHQACRSILSGESAMALAGGITLHLHPLPFLTFTKSSMLSPDGRCRVFDASGNGYVRSEGGGLFLLKDHDRAVADGDRILAVIAGSAVNTDGSKSGLTVPNPRMQAELLQRIYTRVGIEPAQIDYLEAHGTGTAVGDPLETHAIGQALGMRRPQGSPLPIGSVKSNMGHLETAAGVAGMVKAIYSLRHRVVPPTIGVDTPNPRIRFDEWNIKPVVEPLTLPAQGRLTIGVNSFGFGGANAHVVLQSVDALAVADAREDTGDAASHIPLVISGRSAAALRANAHELAGWLQQNTHTSIDDVAAHLASRRDWHTHRAGLFAASTGEAAAMLEAFARGDKLQVEPVAAVDAVEAPKGPVFVYSGNGSQWDGMGADLLLDEVFRDAVAEVDAFFIPLAGHALADELAGHLGRGRYGRTELAQPALFALQVGVTRMLAARGIEPVAVVGHSVGEVAAAWASGALTLADATRVIFERSRLQGMTAGMGQMTAVAMRDTAMQSILDMMGVKGEVCIAGINSPNGITLAGSPAALSKVEFELSAAQARFKRLDLDYAFHSPAMDGIEAGVRGALASLEPGLSRVPFFSAVSGMKIEGTRLDAAYWWQNIRQPVQFSAAIDALIAGGHNIFVEVGPHAVLRGYVDEAIKAADISGRTIATQLRTDGTRQRLSRSAGQLVALAGPAALKPRLRKPGAFLELPSYAWQRERHWHAETSQADGLLHREVVHPLLGWRLAQHELSWEQTLDTRSHPLLAEHQVGDAVVLPSTGFAEMALAAAYQWLGEDVAEIEEIEIRAPLLLSADSTRQVRLKIDPQDGGFAISARALQDEEAWTVHAVGRILREPVQQFGSDAALMREPQAAPDFTGEQHVAMTVLAGLGYGPAFQPIECGWHQDGHAAGRSVLARLRMPESLTAELPGGPRAMHLHPAVLDGAFQLVIQLLREEVERMQGVAFVPVKLGRLSWTANAGMPALARATLVRRTPHALVADIEIHDAQGRCIASLSQLRLRSVRLRKAAHERIQHLVELGVPAPLAVDASRVSLGDGRVREVLQTALADCANDDALRRYADEVEPLLDALCDRFATEPGAESTQEDALTAPELWRGLVAAYPAHFTALQSIGRMGLYLDDLRTGHDSAASRVAGATLLPQLARQAWGESAVKRLGDALAQLASEGEAALPYGARQEILECGSDVPWFGTGIAGVTSADSTGYAVLATHAEHAASLQPWLAVHPHARLLGNEDTPQPIHAIVVVHLDDASASANADNLHRAVRWLAPAGQLVVTGMHPSRWLEFLFKNSQQPRSAWRTQLERQGLVVDDVDLPVHGATGDAESFATGPWLMLARAPAAAQANASSAGNGVVTAAPAPQHWLLVSGTHGFEGYLARHLTTQLEAAGHRVNQVPSGESMELQAALHLAVARDGEVQHVVHLAGLATLPAEGAALAPVVDRCATALALVQAMQAAGVAAPLTLVTAGAAAHLMPRAAVKKDAIESAQQLAMLGDAALWGLGRVLMNEGLPHAVRLVDLAPDVAQSARVSAARLMQEWLALPHADEPELLLAASSARYATRVRPAVTSQAHPQGETSFRLGFDMPGQLRNLRWEAWTPQPPAPQQVEVKVHATGLNFRDVMYTLGLLSDEAIESGFAGPTLGLEFAGTVLRVGGGVHHLKPGDNVLGFGSSSFADRVVTSVDAVSALPQGMGFEAAATVPSTFFTVYYALHYLARLQPGERVLIHGAAGGVGIAAIQLARLMGAEIHASAGSADKRDFLRLMGVQHIHDSRSLSFADSVLAATNGEGVDVVLNSLAGEAINRNLRILRPFGRFMELGKRDFYENTRIGLRPFRNNITYFGIDADQLLGAKPALVRTLFAELMALFESGELSPLPFTAFEARDVVDAFRYMQQARQIGKVVVTYRDGVAVAANTASSAVPVDRLDLRADASYLVTGGLGGFGLRSAQWLAERGARHLVLLGRRGVQGDEAKQAIEELLSQGVQVVPLACDITDATALDKALAEARRQMPPLAGVIHAAAVFEDGLALNMDAGQLHRVAAPKVQGGWNLHRATQRDALDFFVLYSSATTLFGNPGQGNYVAANSWLEALAVHRRRLGLPALSVRWGAIEDAGFLARNEKIRDALQNRMGGHAMPAALALQQLERLLLDDASNLGVLELDWRNMARFLPSAGAARFAALARGASDGVSDDGAEADFARMLVELPEAELHEAVVKMVRVEVGQILRVAPEKIDATQSVYDLGLDSLMGVELQVALEARFGVRLPVMALSETPTLDKLAARLIDMRRASGDAAPAPGADVEAHARAAAALHVTDAQAEGVESLARELVKDSGQGPRLIS